MRFLLATLALGCARTPPRDTTDDPDTVGHTDTARDPDTVGDTDADTVLNTPDAYTDDACVEPLLDLWCFHSEADKGPVVPDTGMAHCAPPSVEGAVPCGAYAVVSSGPAVEGGIDHYFLDAEHVATLYWTDVNCYCGGFVFWYGEPIECQ